MSDVLLYRLRMNRQAILQDLESNQVLDYLYQEDVLDNSKYEEVRDKGPRKKQSELLLSYVERDSSAIQKMIEALETSSQRHLAYILKEELPNEVEHSKGIRKAIENDRDTYPMTRVPCGHAIIINNYKFDEETKLELREGSDNDIPRMEALFEWLQFMVHPHEDLTADKITSVIRKYVVDEDHTNYDCFVLFLMSHGTPNGIYGTDGKLVFFKDIRKQLTATNCYSLANKPKLIFVQACRGKNADMGFVLTDSPHPEPTLVSPKDVKGYPETYTPDNLDQSPEYPYPDPDVTYIPEDSDIITMFASTENRAALRNTMTGGWFVTQLDNVIREFARTEDLQSIITTVARRVSLKKSVENFMQCPEQRGNLRKKLFFNPKRP